MVAGIVPIVPFENGWLRNWTMIVAAETEPPMASAETRAAPAKSAFTLLVIVLVLLLPPQTAAERWPWADPQSVTIPAEIRQADSAAKSRNRHLFAGFVGGASAARVSGVRTERTLGRRRSRGQRIFPPGP